MPLRLIASPVATWALEADAARTKEMTMTEQFRVIRIDAGHADAISVGVFPADSAKEAVKQAVYVDGKAGVTGAQTYEAHVMRNASVWNASSRNEQFIDKLVRSEDPARDLHRAQIFRAASLVRDGEVTTYEAVGLAAYGQPNMARAVASMASKHSDFPNPHRVLMRGGKIADGWLDPDGGGPEKCKRRLEAEGVRFVDSSLDDSYGVADPAHMIDAETLKSRM